MPVLLWWPLTASASILLTGSAESRLELGMDQNVNPQTYFNAAAEYGWNQFYFGGEFFEGKPESTGQSTLTITRLRQGGWATAAWQSAAWNFVIPYLRGGLGGYQDSVTTSFYGSSSTAVSRTYMAGFGGIGFRLKTNNLIFAAIEGRLIFGENENPLPSEALSLRLGLEF